MEHSRVMTLTPVENVQRPELVTQAPAITHNVTQPVFQASSTAPPSTVIKKRKNPVDKLHKLLNIILRLARIDSYDLYGRLKLEDGTIIQNSDIGHLLQHAMMPGKVLIGEQEFIKLLFKAQVEPDMIINDNIRAQL